MATCEPILRITNGTTTVDLLKKVSGFLLSDYNPSAGGYKGGGVFQDSPLSDGRRMVFRRRENVSDVVNVAVKALSQTEYARFTRQLRGLLEQAGQYWIDLNSGAKPESLLTPVWIEARGRDEAVTRYALLYDGFIRDEPNYWRQPFMQPQGKVAVETLAVAIERGDWLSHSPTSDGYAVPIAGYNFFSSGSVGGNNIVTNEGIGSGSYITVTDGAAIQDLPASANGFTYEGWLRTFGPGESNRGVVIRKGFGWILRTDNRYGLLMAVLGATNALRASIPSEYWPFDGEWRHLAVYCNYITDTIRFWVNGVEVSDRAFDVESGAGAYTTDVGSDLFIAASSATPQWTYDGMFGWQRLSNYQRYQTSSFTVPPLGENPAIDANTIVQYNMSEGSGATIDNAEGTAAFDGTATDITWDTVKTYLDIGRGFGNVDEDTNEVVYSTDEDDVFLTNCPPVYNLTNLHISDSSGNSAGGPFPLTVQASGATDEIYFGCVNPINSGPVITFVFEVGQPAAGATVTWQYYDTVAAAWQDCGIDNTEFYDTSAGFTIPGKHVFSFDNANEDWGVVDPGIGSGWWIRANFTVASSQDVTLASRPYIPQNYFDIQPGQMDGDLATRLRLHFNSFGGGAQSWRGYILPAGLTYTWDADTVTLGARSLDRGVEFRSWIPAAYSMDSSVSTSYEYGWTPPGVWMTNNIISSPATYNVITDNPLSPHGVSFYFAMGIGDEAAMFSAVFNEQGANLYKGRYKLYLAAASGGDFLIRASVTSFVSLGNAYFGGNLSSGVLGATSWTGLRNIVSQGSDERLCRPQLVDMGEIDLPDYQFRLQFEANAPAAPYAGGEAYIYGIYLIPADEMLVVADNFGRLSLNGNERNYSSRELDIGGLIGPDSAVGQSNAETDVSAGNIRQASQFALNPSKAYRLHVVFGSQTFFSPDPTSYLGYMQTHSVSLRGMNHYLAMRDS